MKLNKLLHLIPLSILVGSRLCPAAELIGNAVDAQSKPKGARADFGIASDGHPEATVVLHSSDRAEPLLFAAQELERYVRQMSGATLKRSDGSIGGPCIELRVDANLIANRSGTVNAGVAEDRYTIHATSTRLDIAGASPRAVLFAVYDVLERLGCGWCVPGDDSVPKRPTLMLPEMTIDTTPAFQYRMMLDFPLLTISQSTAIADWLAKNRMNWIHPAENAHGEPKLWYERRDRLVPEITKRGLHLIFGGHTMHTWIPEDYAKAHPDWFALNDGERKPPTLCITNNEMTEELIRNMQGFLDRCPEVEVVDLWHPDGQVFCHCPVCTRGLVPESAHGKTPERTPVDAVQSAYVISYVEFMNRVAGGIAKSHPKVMVSPLMYGPSDRAMPDGCPALADNLLPGLAHIFRDSYRPLAGEPKSEMNMRFLGNDITWISRSKNHYIYEYYNCWASPFIYPGAQVIVRDLQLLKQVGCQGTSSDMYGYSPINMYIAARALWSPEISWESTVRDFNVRYYGEAGEQMADNWITLEKGIYGRRGYQANGALPDSWKWVDPASGRWLDSQRPRQIQLLRQLLGQTQDEVVRQRLERALKPWQVWSAEPRWWALPQFPSDTRPSK